MRSAMFSTGSPFVRLFALGLIGVLSLIPEVAPLTATKIASISDFPRIPLALAVGLDLLQPIFLLALGSWLGVRLSPHVGFGSRIAGPLGAYPVALPSIRVTTFHALGASFLVAVATELLDGWFQPAMGAEWAVYIANNPATKWSLFSGLLYGGVTEELIMRWGGMTTIVWVLWRLLQGRTAIPSQGVVWSAIMISAFLFGAGHLPAVSAAVPLTTTIVVRTLGLNAIGGTVFGWFYWKRGLEGAMLCHALVHVWSGVFGAVRRGVLQDL